jgi:sulfatase modifying factor 1
MMSRLLLLTALTTVPLSCKGNADDGHSTDAGTVSAPDAAGGSSGSSAAAGVAGTSGSAGSNVVTDDFDAGACQHPAVIENCSAGWCRVPAGCFVMGSPPGEPGRGAYDEERTAVTLTNTFEVGEHEVTQGEWTSLGLTNPSGQNDDGTGDCSEPECPVGNVTWYEAIAFANLLSESHSPPLEPCYEPLNCTGKLGEGMTCEGAKTTAPSLYECTGYRLPTFAEWEYAARAGTLTAYYGGDIPPTTTIGDCFDLPALSEAAWYCWNSEGRTHPVGQKASNAWGLHDTLGNAAEWINDPPFGISPQGPLVDPGASLVESSMSRVRRGGLYYTGLTGCRVGAFNWTTATRRGPGLGFRLVRTLHD